MKNNAKKITTLLAIGLASIGLTSCSMFKENKPAPVENGYAMGQAGAMSDQNETSAVQTAGVGAGDQFQGQNADTSWMNSTTRQIAQQIGVRDNTIYFAFDNSSVASQYNKLIQANVDYLMAHPSAKVRLEGNTDPRGSREYNIGLGQRRSDQVKQRLIALGVDPSQLITVSYGQERPAVSGDSASAYQLDRRVNIVYTVG